MKKLLNTLYVTTPNAYLSKDGTNVVVSTDGNELFRIPIQNLDSICSFGYQGASNGVMNLCVDNGVSLAFFSSHGRFISRIQGKVNGNVLLRLKQYSSHSDNDFRNNIASLFIYGKIYNSRIVLRRFVRDYADHPQSIDVASSAEKLKRRCIDVLRSDNLDSIRGIEGEASALYFSMFPNLILNNDATFCFFGRNRRPPTDPINAMLSMGYSLLANDCASALEGVGLDPAVGFMHSIRPGRNSLALDLMEEMRSYIVDRLVLSLINTRQFKASDFLIHTNPGESTPTSVIFTDAGMKKFLMAWQNKKKTAIEHPFLHEKIPVGLLPHIQAQLLAKFIRGDLDNYPVFLSK